MPKKPNNLRIAGHEIVISHPDKVLYPSCSFTKGELINYYVRVAPFLLPHLKNRPVMLKQYPGGVGDEAIAEDHAPAITPGWVKRFRVPCREGIADIRCILINNTATLAWAASMAALELHPFLHRTARPNEPTHVVFDLGPGKGADILQCAQVGVLLRHVLTNLHLKSYAKVAGSNEIQVYVPLNLRVSYAATRPFAGAIAELLFEQYPALVAAEKNPRGRKVFVEWSQNAGHQPTLGVYSLRAKREQPYVSMPVRWEELNIALKKGNAESLFFEPEAALRRLKKMGDLFAPMLKLKQRLPAEFTMLPKRPTSRSSS